MSSDIEHIIWADLRASAEALVKEEPDLASYYHANVLNHESLEEALAYVLASRLGNQVMPPLMLSQVLQKILLKDAEIAEAVRADLVAWRTRDPACSSYLDPFLHFKGFHALQSHRMAHALWISNRQWLARLIQSRCAEVFDIDIHPAARFGRGIMLDHGTALVIGETAELGDDVSLLHHVTLGGNGCLGGNRHPKIGDGVLISVGATVLGPIHVGEGAKIGAGSLVLDDVPEHCTVAGVPARIVGKPISERPSLAMDQSLDS